MIIYMQSSRFWPLNQKHKSLFQLMGRPLIWYFKEKGLPSLKYPWDLFNINEYLLKKIRTKIKGKVEKNCQISGPVIVEQGSLLKSGTYIEGPVYIGKNCQIGPNCFIRGFTSIGNNCVIGQGGEIKNSIIGDNSKIPHLNYIGDSIIGESCNLGAGVILANLRFDGKTIKTMVKGEKIDTQRQKFGAVLGNNVKIGVNTSLMPGVLIGSGCIIGPGETVFKNLKDNTKFFTVGMLGFEPRTA